MFQLYIIFIYFVIYAFLGWCLEVCYAYYKTKQFVNRGFLAGPFCPIYGCGVVLLYIINSAIMQRLALNPLVNIPLVFIIVTVVTTGLEYVTGAILKSIFHTRWWDYSERWLNIKGYVCLKFSILWGFAGTVILLHFHQFVILFVNLIPKRFGHLFMAVLLPYFIIDGYYTVKALVNFKYLFNELERASVELKRSRVRFQSRLETLQAMESTLVKEGLRDIKAKITHRTQAVFDKSGLPKPINFEEVKNKLNHMERLQDLKQHLSDVKEHGGLAEMRREVEAWSKRYHDMTKRISSHRLFKAFPEMKSQRYSEHLRHIKEKYHHKNEK